MDRAFEKIADIRLLLAVEAVIGVVTIMFRPYVEIDWEAYMSQVSGFLSGDLDYPNLKGGTGPLVYPAGFLYIFSVLYHLSSQGTNIRLVQYIYLGIYLLNLKVLHSIYNKIQAYVGKFPIVLCCLSYKIHSIYLLRNHNDPIAMLFMYTSVYFAMENKWKTCILFYSLALSIKMNILLYLPGLLLILNWSGNYLSTMVSILFLIAFQLLIAIPFLITNPIGYLTRAFQFSRKFGQPHSAYWQFISEEVFTSWEFHSLLLAVHVTLLILFLFRKASINNSLTTVLKSLNLPSSTQELLHPGTGCKIEPHSNS
jgi:alpha-1,3-mannosyltransferase